MNLIVATPLSVVVERNGVTHLRAEDATGAFGILPGHADFLTILAVSVVTWRVGDTEEHVAVRGGTLVVRDGRDISIVTREAVTDQTLAALGDAVLKRMRADAEDEGAARLAGTRMELAAMRQIERYLATGSNRFISVGNEERGERVAGD